MPDTRRAVYRANLLARRVAGSAPFLRSSETVLLAGRIWQDLWHLAPSIDGEQVEAMAAEARERLAAHLPLARQLSRRTTDLWSAHPSEDQRMRLIEALPGVGGSPCVETSVWPTSTLKLAMAPRRTRRPPRSPGPVLRSLHHPGRAQGARSEPGRVTSVNSAQQG
uniref:Uncharacterized protein n=1 Tax=uncultured bacterium esnapd8 TaxID=1366615 RepID=S5TKS5_9BACT|nr:hypothetical protein [uncultured bacterium esnapd8]